MKHSKAYNNTAILLLMLFGIFVMMKLAPHGWLQNYSWWIVTLPLSVPILLMLILFIIQAIREAYAEEENPF